MVMPDYLGCKVSSQVLFVGIRLSLHVRENEIVIALLKKEGEYLKVRRIK